jgi:SP family galactose:H+ symporter-like MFS transporter
MQTLPASETRNPRFVRYAVGVAALGGLLFGYDTGVISGAILFVKKEFSLSSSMQEFVVSAVLIGAVAGAAVGGKLSQRFGRRRMIIFAGILFAAGALATALAQSINILIAGRTIVGFAIGGASFISPMYISEISPSKIRGSLVSFNQLALTIGIVVSYLVDYLLSGSQDWRLMFGFAGIPATILALAMWRLPPSPRWLISQGKTEEARQILERIRSKSDVEDEVSDIKNSLKQQTAGLQYLLSPNLRMALMVGIGLAVFQQLTGINTVIYYAPTILQSAGFTTAGSAIIATAYVGAVNVALTVVALRFLDRIGRRKLLLIGVMGQALTLVLLGLAFKLPQLSGAVGNLAVGSLMAYVGFFAVGLGPVFWLMISEIYPLMVRSTAMSIATVANWGVNLAVAITFLTLINKLGRPETFWIYAAVGFAAWVFVNRLVPETKGKSLEEIEAHWHAGKHPREMVESRY